MRCPGPSCNKGPHCWRDPIGKKHYKLNTRYLKSLVMYVLEGHTLETHNDVPEDLGEELYAEEQQSLERHQKASRVSASSIPPVHITNVIPAPSGQISQLASSAGGLASDVPAKFTSSVCLDISGYLDEHVKEYCAWQQSRVKKPSWKEDYLNQIRKDPNPDILICEGVQSGTAKRVVSEIDYWFETTKRARTEE
ncbi:hypothetical protein B0O99DRAFT_746948 [Bisporella sp. PMI_857]|nr:hypothetical protein B0O99DRAFT_746948 [Bisporella sp. PMI_857]